MRREINIFDWMILFCVMTIICMFLSEAFAADKHFKYITPIDKKITSMLAWDNTKDAVRYSDYTLWASSIYPYAYVLGKSDTNGHNRIKRLTTIATVQVLNSALTDLMKIRAKRTRPDGSDTRSFYSGHSSSAFANAALVCHSDRKTKHRVNCITVLSLAASTAYFRLAGRRHHFSDIVMGVGVGFAFGRYIPVLVVEF